MDELIKKYWLLLIFFLFAVSIRFLYFPNNIYFGFDQARDAFVVQELLQGNLRLVGPTTLIDGLFHGPLYYYIFAPIYFLSQGNPEWVSAFLRIVNASGVFLVFLIGLTLFGRKTGFLAAFLYAISFEQTQFAIYLNHPSLSIQTVLLYYLGLTLLLFKKKWWGLIVAVVGLGLSIQFEFPLIYLSVSLVLILLTLGWIGKELPKLKLWQLSISLMAFLLTISTFILAEIKFHFRGISTLIHGILLQSNNVPLFSSGGEKADVLHNVSLIYSRYIGDSIFYQSAGWIGLLIFFVAVYFIWKKLELKKTTFLLIWFGVGIIPYIKNTASIPLYYYSGAASVAAIIFVSFLLIKLAKQNIYLPIIICLIIVASNFYQIQKFNPLGTIPSINVQSGMLWSDQKKVVDYMYQEANGQPFAVNSLSVPLNVNMVWSYVIEQYGQQKYGYLPVWGGDAADGYYGNLKVEKARSNLPKKQFLILEPTRGIEQYMIDDFMNQEDIFNKKIDQAEFGLISVQKRQKI